MTSKETFLSEVFEDNNKNVNVTTKQFLKRLKFCVSKCFKKIRISHTKKNKVLEDLFNQRRILKTKKDDKSNEALKKVEYKLSEMCSEDKYRIVQEACAGLSCEEGGLNDSKLWKLKRNLRGIVTEPPTAMLDLQGNLVTRSNAIEKLTMEMYSERLKALNIKEDLKLHQLQQENLCEKRLKETQANKTPLWTKEDIDEVLKELKNNKSRDPMALAIDLFKPDNAGADLKTAVRKLMNQIKTQLIFPEPLRYCNITSL